MNKIVERRWTAFGYHIHLRVTPQEYEDTLKDVSRLVDDVVREGKRAYRPAKDAIEAAYKRWGCNHELVRLDTLVSFMTEDGFGVDLELNVGDKE